MYSWGCGPRCKDSGTVRLAAGRRYQAALPAAVQTQSGDNALPTHHMQSDIALLA